MKNFLRLLAATIVAGAARWFLGARPRTGSDHLPRKSGHGCAELHCHRSTNKYVNGLKPTDFKVYEDDIAQKLATFAEGTRAPVQVLENGETRPLPAGSAGGAGTGTSPGPGVVNLSRTP